MGGLLNVSHPSPLILELRAELPKACCSSFSEAIFLRISALAKQLVSLLFGLLDPAVELAPLHREGSRCCRPKDVDHYGGPPRRIHVLVGILQQLLVLLGLVVDSLQEGGALIPSL